MKTCWNVYILIFNFKIEYFQKGIKVSAFFFRITFYAGLFDPMKIYQLIIFPHEVGGRWLWHNICTWVFLSRHATVFIISRESFQQHWTFFLDMHTPSTWWNKQSSQDNVSSFSSPRDFHIGSTVRLRFWTQESCMACLIKMRPFIQINLKPTCSPCQATVKEYFLTMTVFKVVCL